jgi:hypothetical protein
LNGLMGDPNVPR